MKTHIIFSLYPFVKFGITIAVAHRVFAFKNKVF